MALSFLQCGLVLAALSLLIIRVVRGRSAKAHGRPRSLPLPPGPKPLPLIGNLQDLPPPGVQEWIHWSKHRDLYGPISSVTVLGQTIVILNDSRAAIDLLERRSAIHSSRPRLVFAFEMCGWLNFLSSQPYGDRFRAYRKQVHGLLGTAQPLLERFGRLQEQEVGRCLLRVLQKPRDFVSHIRTEAGATILKIAYGYTIEPHGPEPDPLVSIADEALDQFSKATVPGRWMVDVLPSLRYLPDWFPGAGFKRTARHWDDTVRHVVEDPYRFVQEHPTEATANSFVGDCLRNEEKLDDEQKFVVKWTAASLYTGGADTTVSSLTIFCLAMTLYPEVQKKAQEEIDRVVGTDRLPTFGDRASLPYVEAVVKETMRWHPIGPMGVPHMSTEDDEYDGYLIPKGAILMPNVWLMTHDPETYHDPARFNPDRFLSDKSDGEATPEQDPNRYVFGFGRRICPGRVLADQSIYLTIAQMLAVFEFSKPDGAEIHPEFEAGIISHPRPFQTNIEVRDPQREKLIRDIEVKYPWEKSDAAYFKDLQRSQKA